MMAGAMGDEEDPPTPMDPWDTNKPGGQQPSSSKSSVDRGVVMSHEWILPSQSLHGMWESLVFEPGLTDRLLAYVSTAMLFSDLDVDPALITWNRFVALYMCLHAHPLNVLILHLVRFTNPLV